jgi:hypothetical protein
MISIFKASFFNIFMREIRNQADNFSNLLIRIYQELDTVVFRVNVQNEFAITSTKLLTTSVTIQLAFSIIIFCSDQF